MNLAGYIEHTSLKPILTDADLDRLLEEAKAYGFHGVCIPPFWVKKAARDLQSTSIQLVTVIGFPLGYNMTEVKMKETEVAIDNGARELDVVMNISAFKAGMHWVKIELAKLAGLIHRYELFMKVIIETGYLQDDEIRRASTMAAEAGADYIKTSTGFGPRGASIKDILLIKESIPSSVQIKASGGIQTKEQALAFIQAGAARIGTSSGAVIVT